MKEATSDSLRLSHVKLFSTVLTIKKFRSLKLSDVHETPAGPKQGCTTQTKLLRSSHALVTIADTHTYHSSTSSSTNPSIKSMFKSICFLPWNQMFHVPPPTHMFAQYTKIQELVFFFRRHRFNCPKCFPAKGKIERLCSGCVRAPAAPGVSFEILGKLTQVCQTLGNYFWWNKAQDNGMPTMRQGICSLHQQ